MLEDGFWYLRMKHRIAKCTPRDIVYFLKLCLKFYLLIVVMITGKVFLNLSTKDNKTIKIPELIQNEGKDHDKTRLLHNPKTERRQRKTLYGHEALTFSNGFWQSADVCRSLPVLKDNPDFFLVKSQSEAGTVPLYVHNPNKDAISGTIKERRSFESGNVDTVVSLLRKDPELSFIDIGTNVGQHAMAAALLGKQVIAVDAAKENIQHVCASVKYNHFSNRITIVHNAVSDTHEKLKFRHGMEGDFGLGHVDMDNIQSKMDAKFLNYFKMNKFRNIESVKLDDFLDIPGFSFMKNILIKIDVEGHEHRVLLGAKKFMEKKMKNIKGIMMEWQWFGGREAEQIILQLMKTWIFQPFRFIGKFEILDVNKTHTWPPDVLWLPQNDDIFEDYMENKHLRYSRRIKRPMHTRH